MRITKEHMPWYDDERDAKRRYPSLWICPVCGTVNAWNWDDAERASRLLKVAVYVSTGSCFDNICGMPACRADITKPDSPINAPCYTHSED